MSDGAATSDYGYRTQGVPVLQIPLDKTAAGPATLYRWRRTALIYALVFAFGVGLAWTASAYWASFGLGLMFPGAGFPVSRNRFCDADCAACGSVCGLDHSFPDRNLSLGRDRQHHRPSADMDRPSLGGSADDALA